MTLQTEHLKTSIHYFVGLEHIRTHSLTSLKGSLHYCLLEKLCTYDKNLNQEKGEEGTRTKHGFMVNPTSMFTACENAMFGASVRGERTCLIFKQDHNGNVGTVRPTPDSVYH